MLSNLCFRLLTRKTFLMEGENLSPILSTLFIFPFELFSNVTFPFILVMLENNKLSPVICPDQAL